MAFAQQLLSRKPTLRVVFLSGQAGERAIAGVMLESHLQDGKQPLQKPLQYGLSITDGCLGWDRTEQLLRDID